MGKGRFFGSAVAAAATVAMVGYWAGGCGLSNDQGISFRALGFFADGTSGDGDTGDRVDINTDDTVPSDDDGDGELDGGYLGLENNMVQGINVERVDLSYRVSGASIAIPNDSFGLSMRLGPSSNQEPGNPPRAFAQILIVSPQIMEFLDQNRTRFPDFPYTMIATAQGVGVTDAGDVFRTNKVHFTIVVDEQPVPEPTPGTEPTPGA